MSRCLQTFDWVCISQNKQREYTSGKTVASGCMLAEWLWDRETVAVLRGKTQASRTPEDSQYSVRKLEEEDVSPSESISQHAVAWSEDDNNCIIYLSSPTLRPVCLYADDSTLYTSATTVTEMTATLNKELQSVSEQVARNKLGLNIYKTKSIVFGTNHSLNPKPQRRIVINHVEIEQVEAN